MKQRVFWVGAILGLVMVIARNAATHDPVVAAGAGMGGAMRPHAFSHGVPVAKGLPGHGAAFLSMVSGGEGIPAVAAVREEGKLRLVRAGDTLDGAVVASIATTGLTLRAADKTIVLTKHKI